MNYTILATLSKLIKAKLAISVQIKLRYWALLRVNSLQNKTNSDQGSDFRQLIK